MAGFCSLVLPVAISLSLSLVLLLVSGGVSAEDSQLQQYYVSPDNQSSICNNDTQVHKCDTLMHFVANVSTYFTSNTKFVFLAGDHYLEDNTTVTVSNVESLTLIGCNYINSTLCNDSLFCSSISTPEIKCTDGGQGGFEFKNVTNLKIEKLTITGCGWVLPYDDYNTMVVLKFTTTFNLSLEQIIVQNGTGYGILAHRMYGYSEITNCLFQHNSGTPDYIGGNVAVSYVNCDYNGTTLLKIKSSQFLYGSYQQKSTTNFATGLVIYLYCSRINITIDNATMVENEAIPNRESLSGKGGNMAIVYYNPTDSVVNNVSIKNSWFIGGRAQLGGGVYISYFINANSSQRHAHQACNNQLSISNAHFIGNHANEDGGGLHFHFSQGYAYGKCQNITNFLVRNCTFINNTVTQKSYSYVGTAVGINNYYVWGIYKGFYVSFTAFFSNCTYTSNRLIPINSNYTTYSGSAVFYASQQVGRTTLQDCTFSNNTMTAISTFRSYLTFEGELTIINNTGLDGGGVLLCEASYMILRPYTTVTIVNNHARQKGGGIFAESRCSQSNPLCFFQIDSTNYKPESDNETIYDTIEVILINNTADFAGSQIYGGTLNLCYVEFAPRVVRGTDVFDKIFNVSEHNPNDLSYVSSDPFKVCFCIKNKPNCNITEWRLTQSVYPGQQFSVSAVTVGQLNGSSPGDVHVWFINRTDEELGYRQDSQHTYHHCTWLNYTIYSHPGTKTLALSVENPYFNNTLDFESRFLHVSLKQCPLGFKVKKGDKVDCKCVDQPDIYKFGFRCNIKEQQILRPAPAWIGYHFANESSIKGTVDGVIYHSICPLDFCSRNDANISVTSTYFDQDVQCAFNRTGILCGACQSGTSIVFGSTACLDCSGHTSIHILVYIVVFILGGIVLLIVLVACNLTVTEGTISGLIFYANIVELSRFTFFQTKHISLLQKVLNYFIAALNFQLGIETCFYDGMDSFANTWFHFTFPIYILTMAGAIIYLSKRWNWMTNLIGNNAVPVLATLILLSYTTFILGVTRTLSVTIIAYPAPNGSTINKAVWLYDGNIDYLTGKHIPLFILGMIFGVLSLLYTLLLLCIQPLERFSHWKCLKWVAMLKPLVDAYSSPHIIKENYRFWNGLLLLFRVIFAVLAVSMTSVPQLYLTILTSACVFILTLAWSLGGIYKKWPLNLLTASYVINLATLSITTTYVLNTDSEPEASVKQALITNISFSIAAVTFVAILMYHIYMRLRKCRCCRYLREQCKRRIRSWQRNQVGNLDSEIPGVNNSEEVPLVRSAEHGYAATTGHTGSVQYREPQLADFDVTST